MFLSSVFIKLENPAVAESIELCKELSIESIEICKEAGP